MKLYKTEDQGIIFATQVKDPFFSYVTGRFFRYVTKPHSRILDIGCGSGRNVITAARRGHTAVGLDIDPTSITVAKAYAKREHLEKQTEFHVADVMKLRKWPYGTFDYCIMQEVIEHVEDYQKLVDIAYRALKPGGMLLLSTPNDPRQWNILDDYAEHVRRFEPAQVRKALRRFKSAELFTFGFPFHRMMIAFYNTSMSSVRKEHEAKRFRKNSFVQSAYAIIGSVLMRVDGLWRTPYGTTIIAVARK